MLGTCVVGLAWVVVGVAAVAAVVLPRDVVGAVLALTLTSRSCWPAVMLGKWIPTAL